MTSVDKVKSICKERKIPISRLERDLGYANGYIGQLRKGTFPNDRLIEIASYLNIPTSYLSGEDDLNGQIEKPTLQTESELDPVTKELFDIVNSSDEDELKALLEMARLIKKRRDA